jgi:hypothetical protein
MRGGTVLAVLRLLDCGHAFRVVAEVFNEGPPGIRPPAVKPYTFRTEDDANAFVDDALGAFAYLGCDIKHA